MSPKQRFQVMLEPKQLEWLRLIEKRTGARIGEQIRRAINMWIDVELPLDEQTPSRRSAKQRKAQ